MSAHADLLRAAAVWCQEHYPGLAIEAILLRVRGLPEAVRLPIAPGLAAVPVDASEERGRGGLDRCTKDILAALREAGRPLSKTRLLEVMDERFHRGEGGEWSERTVCRRLAELMADGTIENEPDARPRGYRIPAEGEA